MRTQIEVPAIRDRDLREILDKLGISQRIDSGELDCCSCSGIVTWDAIGALLVREGNVLVCCHLSECIEDVTRGTER